MPFIFVLYLMLSWKHESEWVSGAFDAPAATIVASPVIVSPCPVDAKKRRLRCPE
jgi:hypothetical protein